MQTMETREVKSLGEVTGNPIDQQALLRFTELRKAFGGQTVLDGVSGELRPGEVVLLQGANGSGKTTLLNTLTGNLQPDAGEIELFTHGKPEVFRFPQPWLKRLNPLTHFAPEQLAGLGVGRTWQDIRLFSTQSLLNNIAIATAGQLGENPLWALFRRSTVMKQERDNCRDAQAKLAMLGLAGREKSSADKVSLGQSKRVAIAMAVQAGAKILFLDEPLAGLDATGVAEVMELLAELAYQHQVTLVIVEHLFNIPRILELATTVWTLETGRLTIQRKEIVAKALKKKRLLYRNLDKWFEALAKDCQRSITDKNLSKQATLSVISSETPKQQNPEVTQSKEIILEVSDLVVYQGHRLVIGEQRKNGVIKGLSFKLHRGEVGLLTESGILQAANGWGKTTLLEAIAGTIPIYRGTIRFQGRLINQLKPWKRVELGLSFLQSRNNYFPSLTVSEALRLCQISRIPTNLIDLTNKKVSFLSGGERQKLALACFMNKEAPLLLMDEPFSALDILEVEHLQKKIAEIIKAGKTILIAIPKPIEISNRG